MMNRGATGGGERGRRERAERAGGQGWMPTALNSLANISARLGRSLQRDPVKGQIVNDAEANQLLRRRCRAPWTHPEPAQG